MKTIRWVFALLIVASSALAEPTPFPGNPESYKKLEPSGAYNYSAGDDQWHANSSSYPMYCSVTSGAVTTTPARCSNPWVSVIDVQTGTDQSIALTGCVTGTCKSVVVDNIGSNPVLIQTNSATGTSGVWLAGATAHPEMMHSVDLSQGPAVTALYKTTTGVTAPAAYGTIGSSELLVTACD